MIFFNIKITILNDDFEGTKCFFHHLSDSIVIVILIKIYFIKMTVI